ncbi:DNA repair protein [Pedobacter cryoconitis]|uniref:DNA repair protein n=1 Tax=Pedobacter cryoconitis TaxID=188932 RepID=A0A127VJZ8_9SPHI|nr:ATP-binding protein [Pedobacter cryoconitis]AMQ01645.1 DNA repair protein [Pedobacter cryoconitis]
MRYLNKIIFINSANIFYSEISIDGNVHFIGTQGVGKSTTLRAILFFYNADKLKLGIEKGKKSFDEYYFPNDNSFLIYEVMSETGPFTVLAFKAQGRAAFRFIDGPYLKENYINQDNKAMTWDQIRATLAGTFNYSRKIDRYEEYRDILYGNNKGLPAEFRKYALIESRQYQNLPRTIQNVFLNSKLEAEFIKQTIIMSLNEEDVKIDLDQYALHLQNFQEQLADISKWSEKNRIGEVVVRTVANNIAALYSKICFLEKDKIEAAQLLIAAHSLLQKSFPVMLKQLENEQVKLAAACKKVAEANQKFQEKKEKITKEIILLDAKLKEAKLKSEDYERQNITLVIQRIAQRIEWENQRNNLQKEQELLSSRFKEITSKYEALTVQLQNRLSDFINSKNAKKNELQHSFYTSKEELVKQYEKIAIEIEQEKKDVKINIEQAIASHTNLIHELELRKKEAELKPYFETEILQSKRLISDATHRMQTAEVDIQDSKRQIESLQKTWDFDITKYDSDYNFQTIKVNERITAARLKIEQTNLILDKSKDSLYTWLHENKPGWEQTIGKVIDQEQVLFQSGLSPKINRADNGSFFGVEIDLKEISASVKTIDDYKRESQQFSNQIKKAEDELISLGETRGKEQEKFKKKYQPQIKALKDLIALREYESQKAVFDKDLASIQLEEWNVKAATERKNTIHEIKQEIEKVTQERQLANERLQFLIKQTRTQVEEKRRERENRIALQQKILEEAILKLDKEIQDEEMAISMRKEEIKLQSNNTLKNEGADMVRISTIEKELVTITEELQFIERNRDLVADYNKDKRELFDHVDVFKANKKVSETRLLSEQQRHELVKVKLQEVVDKLKVIIDELEGLRKEADEDLKEFDSFTGTEVFSRLNHNSSPIKEIIKPSKRLKILIQELNDISFGLSERLTDLRSAISKFLSNFSYNNVFGFQTNPIENEDYLRFAENLKEFLEEDKIGEYERRTNEHFASLIIQLGKETTALVSKEGIILNVIRQINKDFEERNFAGVIKSINLRLSASANKIVMLLSEIRAFNDENKHTLGKANLFSTDNTEANNKKAVSYLKNFAAEIATSKTHEINLSDTFELEFKIVENDNDSGWVEKLTNVGSEGTDILVKAMINIMLLNVFKESASKRFKDFRLHCMMDEIGKLHPNNVKGILKFANDRNIVLINSSPTSYNALDYRHTYLLSKDSKSVTTVKKLITNN